ncbi:MAG: amidase [Burkholderiales bacterium]
MKEYEQFDAMGLANLVRTKAVSADELLEAAITRNESLRTKINALSVPCYEHGREAIKRGLPPGPFAGVPFVLKDLHALCNGTLSSNGSRFFQDNVADHDTAQIARYKRGGLVIFGKSSTPEFGLTVTTEPKVYGPTRNPWNADYMAGGSSGGSAAAVAAGIVPAAHATDGGGSIRIPASCCGLVGLKPTRGRNPAGPDRGEGWSGMSHEHVVTRSVRDSAALLDLTAGPDAGAPYFAERPQRPFLAEVGAEPGKLRIGLALKTPAGEALHAECAEAVRDAAIILTALGHHVEEVTLSPLPEDFSESFRTAIGGNIRAAVDSYAKKKGKTVQREFFEYVTWMFYEMGGKASAADYARAVLGIHGAGRHVAQWFAGFDLLLTPTLPDPPQKIGVFNMDSPVLDDYARAITRLTSFTAPFNASGSPAVSLPLHWTADGLPVGVQLAAPYGEEAILIRLASQLEAAKPWFNKRPPI